MFGRDDSDYYRRRAAQERALADAATTPEVQAAHQAIAVRYAALAGDAGTPDRPALRLAS